MFVPAVTSPKIECDPMRLRFIVATWKLTVEMWQCMVHGH
jgi:hypothetical protein